MTTVGLLHPGVLVSFLSVRLTVPPAEVAGPNSGPGVRVRTSLDARASARGGVIQPRWALRTSRGEFILTSTIIVGRGVGSDLQIDDESVSRRHARIRLECDNVLVEDLGSRNGTWVNRSAVSAPKLLTYGDRVSIGACEFELVSVAPPGSNRVTQPAMQAVQPPSARSLASLSPRERTVFPLLASGLSQREIASQCGVTVKTIETYRTRIGHKLGLSTRAELVRFALETGVLRPSDTDATS
jgi:DNA-binding CsgD family transcriptional regulator